MYTQTLSHIALFATVASASPIFPFATSSSPVVEARAAAYNWLEGWQKDFPIHESCNATATAELKRAFADLRTLSQHAMDHILRFGNESEIYTKYFGNGSTAQPIGWYDRIVNADKSEMLFRCDDPDQNCATQPTYAGHWRGSNATLETVICERSFFTRLPLEAMCARGYTVAGMPLNTYFGLDLLHRVFHVPTIGEGVVEHFAETYEECLELAEEDPEEAAINSDTLQYFAAEAYAFDIALPGTGCAGELPEATQAPSSAVSSAAATVTEPPSTTVAVEPSKTSTASVNCHTHADGEVHCV